MLLCVAVPSLWTFALGIFMVGMSAAVFGLAPQSYLTEAVPIEFRARALSTLGGVMRIGLFIGPFLAAAVIHRVGLAGAYGVGVVSLLLSALVAVRIPDLRIGWTPQAGPTRRRGPATHDPVDRLRPPPPLPHRRHRILLVSAVRASRQVVIRSGPITSGSTPRLHRSSTASPAASTCWCSIRPAR
jgi:MFS family permease